MNWIKDLISLLFPRYCKVCGRRLTHSENHLCISCLLELPRTHYELIPENLLMQHFIEWPEVVSATAYLYYYKEGKYSSLIHHLKYHDHPEVGTYLGRLAATELRESGFFDGIDLIIPVPLSRKRYRQRGYNQSDYIAQGTFEFCSAMFDIKIMRCLLWSRFTRLKSCLSATSRFFVSTDQNRGRTRFLHSGS